MKLRVEGGRLCLYVDFVVNVCRGRILLPTFSDMLSVCFYTMRSPTCQP